MADTAKVLAQVDPAAATPALAYTVPGSTSTVISTLTVANRSATDTAFRISIRVGGAGVDDKQYIYYDHIARGNRTFASTFGITLAATDLVYVYATLATLSFSIFGVEITA